MLFLISPPCPLTPSLAELRAVFSLIVMRTFCLIIKAYFQVLKSPRLSKSNLPNWNFSLACDSTPLSFIQLRTHPWAWERGVICWLWRRSVVRLPWRRDVVYWAQTRGVVCWPRRSGVVHWLWVRGVVHWPWRRGGPLATEKGCGPLTIKKKRGLFFLFLLPCSSLSHSHLSAAFGYSRIGTEIRRKEKKSFT